MTTCREIVRAAFEEVNALVGSEPDSRDGEIGMRRLNALINGMAGMGIGEPLKDVEYEATPLCALPINTRAVVIAGGITLTLPCEPQDGSRIQVIDAGADFNTSNVTIARNDRLLEGVAANITANTASYSRTWFYRADLADWKAIDETLALADTFPFPAATEEAFTVLLALRLSPVTGVPLSAESQATVQHALSTLRTRYRQRVRTNAETALLRNSAQAFGGNGHRC